MLEIGLVPKASGSTGFGRFYPHEGYLGLCPVVVEGTIVARLPPLYPSLPISQVTVTIRCIATRTIGSDVEAVLWEKAKRLWQPVGDEDYEELGDWTAPFKIAIPVEAAWEAGSAQWTRDLKVTWQLQVAFDHKPIPYVGNRIVKTYLLNVHSYVTQPIPPPSPPSAIHTSGAQISINPPHGTFGPGETFTVSLHVKPDDPIASIRRTTLIVERRTQLIDSIPRKLPIWRRSNSPQPYTKLEEAMVHTTKVLEVTSEEAVPGSGGVFYVSMSGTIPKRGGKWEAGETGETKVTMTTFDCRVKVSLKTKSKQKEIVCPPVQIVLVGSTAAERNTAHAALAAEAESHPKASLPKRKHRSSRRGLYMHEGTIDIANPVVGPAWPTRSPSPTLPIFVPTFSVKPILLPSNPTPQPQSISFAFPSKPALPITTLIHPPSPTVAYPSQPSYPDMSILRQYQATGRRISTSTSEEEEIQPSRSRLRLDTTTPPPAPPSVPTKYRPSLPSLDVLGLRLPPVPEYDAPRRPRTAPVHSAFPSPGPKGSVPPPLSGQMPSPFELGVARPVTSGAAARMPREQDEGAFAFGVEKR